MSERLAAREGLQCRPGTVDTVRRRRSEATASGRCLPPAAGGSNVPPRVGTAEPPRGPCSPSAAMSTPVLVLIVRHKHTCFKVRLFCYISCQTDNTQTIYRLFGNLKGKYGVVQHTTQGHLISKLLSFRPIKSHNSVKFAMAASNTKSKAWCV